MPHSRILLILFTLGLPGSMAWAASPITNSLGMRLQPIPAGRFVMGNQDPDAALFEMPEHDPELIADETPAHGVEITQPFLLGRTEVTQAQWLELMGNRPGPVESWQRADWKALPVVSVTWLDVQAFMDRLNQREPGHHYRLPTEAEWEYAARAGSHGLRPFPRQQLDQHAWYLENSGDRIHPVATRKPNAWGLYDTLGNAWEWVADWYGNQAYADPRQQDPSGPPQGAKKVRRGGSFHCPPHMVRPGYRAIDRPGQAYSVLGFRVVRELGQR